MSDWFNGEDWLGNLQKEAEKIRTEEKVNKRLLENVEYQEKIKDIDIQIGLLNKKIRELANRKLELQAEYANKELKAMGAKYKYVIKEKGVFG